MQTLTLTISVPDEVASRFHALPADITTGNRFAVAALPGLLSALDAVEEDDELPADFYQKHPLPPSLSGSLADDLREAFADVDAGRVYPGEVVLAELRQRAGRK